MAVPGGTLSQPPNGQQGLPSQGSGQWPRDINVPDISYPGQGQSQSLTPAPQQNPAPVPTFTPAPQRQPAPVSQEWTPHEFWNTFRQANIDSARLYPTNEIPSTGATWGQYTNAQNIVDRLKQNPIYTGQATQQGLALPQTNSPARFRYNPATGSLEQ